MERPLQTRTRIRFLTLGLVRYSPSQILTNISQGVVEVKKVGNLSRRNYFSSEVPTIFNDVYFFSTQAPVNILASREGGYKIRELV